MGLTPQQVVLGVALALWCAACALSATRAWPIAVRRRVKHVEDAVLACEAIVEALESKWIARTTELTALSEEIEGYLAAVEKRRRRIAASEGRNGATPPPDADPYTELQRRARAQ